ncbi:flagellar motor protein MotB [Serpentinicella sp. ANB-PHB4]|uniref:OmpA/MotB family protein n=1 Tax=Serpentinicella sp. ANB-PHB4 TaxID=3074076 RepID=UPI0028555620|nr:flagellar motor protein MotB [Serpentinicella sp. ANB-PHB4]MDR5659297.1 flagellar motor protein MotB [Serpentinicella sp. ANB-PHB4]
MEQKKDKKNYKLELSNNWIITYSDMITIVLCFFIIFFVLTAEENSVLSQVKNTLANEVDDLSDKVDELSSENEELSQKLFGLTNIEEDMNQSSEEFILFLRENDLIDSVKIEQNERGLLIRFEDNILFSSGKAYISNEGLKVLDKIGDKLNKIDNNVIIEGYTDNIPMNTPIYPSNWELSAARAINVARYFIEHKDVSENRLSISGYGEQNPIDTNKTPEGRSRNRRIEITIVN